MTSEVPNENGPSGGGIAGSGSSLLKRIDRGMGAFDDDPPPPRPGARFGPPSTPPSESRFDPLAEIHYEGGGDFSTASRTQSVNLPSWLDQDDDEEDDGSALLTSVSQPTPAQGLRYPLPPIPAPYDDVDFNFEEPGRMEAIKDWAGNAFALLKATKIIGIPALDSVKDIGLGTIMGVASRYAYDLTGEPLVPVIATSLATATGAVSSGIREYKSKENVDRRKEVKDLKQKEKKESDAWAKQLLKDQIRSITAENRTMVLFGCLKGAVRGAVGAMIGSYVATEYLPDLPQQLPTINIGNVGESLGKVPENVQNTLTNAFNGLKNELGKLLAGGIPDNIVTGPPHVAPDVNPTGMPESFTLEKGHTVWGDVRAIMEQQLGYPPTNAQVQAGVNQVLADSENIIDTTRIPAGTSIDISNLDDVVAAIKAVATPQP